MIILETPRLLLRYQDMSDLDALYALYCDPRVSRYIPDVPTSLEETRAEIAWHEHGHPRHPELGLWATVHKESAQYIGRCGLLPWTIDARFEVEVAYLVDPAFWGKGLATEAALAIRDYGFHVLKLPRLVCLIEEDNIASRRVAEKMGMTFEKEARDEHGPFQLYAMSQPTP